MQFICTYTRILQIFYVKSNKVYRLFSCYRYFWTILSYPMNYHFVTYGSNCGWTFLIDSFFIKLMVIYFEFDKSDITMETICFLDLYLLCHIIWQFGVYGDIVVIECDIRNCIFPCLILLGMLMSVDCGQWRLRENLNLLEI